MNLQKLFEKTFKVHLNEDKFNKLKINDIPEWDSMGNINFILAMEKEFKIRFSVIEIESLDSITSIKNKLLEKGIK